MASLIDLVWLGFMLVLFGGASSATAVSLVISRGLEMVVRRAAK